MRIRFPFSGRFLLTAVFAFALIAPKAAMCQTTEGGASPLQVRNAVGTILLSGLVGGILGLSTLSFYSQPQDNIRNIFWGAGGGMIIATLAMTFTVATSPIPEQNSGDSSMFESQGTLKLVSREKLSNWQLLPVLTPSEVAVAFQYRF